jgi:hypothetical protein
LQNASYEVAEILSFPATNILVAFIRRVDDGEEKSAESAPTGKEGEGEGPLLGALVSFTFRCYAGPSGPNGVVLCPKLFSVKLFFKRDELPSCIIPAPPELMDDVACGLGGDADPNVGRQSEVVFVGTHGGAVKILGIRKMEVVAEHRFEDVSEIMSMFYCLNVERVCCVTR